MINFEFSVSKAYIAKAAGVLFDREYYFDPVSRYERDRRCHDYIESRFSEIGAFYTESNLGRREYYNPKQVLVGGIQPNMILGMLLGAEFIPNVTMDADITPNCIVKENIKELPELESLPGHKLIKLFGTQIAGLKNDPDKIPIPPFFWDSSGRAAIHGAMTTAQKFLGEGVFLDMMTDPDHVKQIVNWVIEAYIVLIKYFAGLTNIKIRSVHIGECSSCMIGPEQFEDFVVPGLNRIGESLGSVRLHSCGFSNHILEICKEKIPSLCSLDLGGETSMAKVRKIFGNEFPISIAPVAADLSGHSSDTVLSWFDRIIKENNGGNLTISCHIEPEYNLEAIRAMYKRGKEIN